MVSKQGHGEERNFDRGGGKTFGGGGGVGHAEDVGWIGVDVLLWETEPFRSNKLLT